MRLTALTFVALSCIATPSFADWYEGGTLHRANFGEWKSASASNRLATSGDWAAHILGETQVRQMGMDGLRRRAQQLSNCVTEAATGTSPNLAASQAAAACAVLMNW